MYIFVTQELKVKLAELQEKTESAEKERQQQLQQMNEVIQSLWLFYYVFLNFINHNVLFIFLIDGPREALKFNVSVTSYSRQGKAVGKTDVTLFSKSFASN